jgi:hypothetical protein
MNLNLANFKISSALLPLKLRREFFWNLLKPCRGKKATKDECLNFSQALTLDVAPCLLCATSWNVILYPSL